MSEVIHVMDPIPTVEKVPVPITTADSLLSLAIQKGSSIEQLTQLFDLKLRVDADEARKAFVKAMAGFRSEVKTIHKNGVGHNNARYATLDAITDAINPILAKNDLSFCWSIEQGNQITVHCDVTHIAGHSQRTTLAAAPDDSGKKNAIQSVGSTVTYLQRYTLNAALGLATGVVDDDGNASGDYPRITEDQAAEINQLLQETNYDMERFLRIHGTPSVDEMHEVSYGPAMNLLLSKQAAAKKRSTSVTQTVIDEQKTTADPQMVASYVEQIRDAVFNRDDQAIRQLYSEMGNDLELIVHRQLSSQDRSYVRDAQEIQNAE